MTANWKYRLPPALVATLVVVALIVMGCWQPARA